MKKLLTIIVGLLAIASTALATQHSSESFLSPNISALYATTNSYSTNFLSPTATTSYSTNETGVKWTNNTPYLSGGTTFISGALVIVTNDATKIGWNTNGLQGPIYVTNSTMPLFKDVPLWADLNGSSMAIGAASMTYPTNSYGVIMTKFVGASVSATGTVVLVFSTLPDGENEITANGGDFTVSVTLNGTTPVTTKTIIPSSYLVGCKALRLRSVYASAAANVDASWWLQAVKLCGFVP